MRKIAGLSWLWASLLAYVTIAVPRPAGAQAPVAPIHLDDDQPVTLRFYGAPDADLFTHELDASFQGVLKENFYATARDGFPAGFISASAPGMPWGGTMWTRDAGTFLRELVMRGYYQHAALIAECLMHLVEKNQDGFYTFPRYFKGSTRDTGTEFDGTAAIIIAMEALWEPEISLCGFVAGELLRLRLAEGASRRRHRRVRLRHENLRPVLQRGAKQSHHAGGDGHGAHGG